MARETTSLALHQITVLGCSPFELVDIASELGCDGVCVFVHAPASPGRPAFPVVTRAMLPALRARLREAGVRVTNLEYFPIRPGLALDGYREALALGAELGAARIVTHLHDPEPARGLESLGALAAMAAEFGLDVGLEMLAISPGCPNLARALELVDAANCANLGVGVDALHLARSGGRPAQLAARPAGMFSYAQLCDGPSGTAAPGDAAYLAEAFDRLVPGEGGFPLVEMARALPAWLAFDVEVPARRLERLGIAPREHARAAVAGARRVLAAARGG